MPIKSAVPMGHRYPGELKVYYLSIFQDSTVGEKEKPVKGVSRMPRRAYPVFGGKRDVLPRL